MYDIILKPKTDKELKGLSYDELTIYLGFTYTLSKLYEKTSKRVVKEKHRREI